MKYLDSLIVAMLFAGVSSSAADFEITVLDRHGEPVPDVAVYIQSDFDESTPQTAGLALMQQIDFRFEPDVLVVQTGSRVQFPNNDVVAHHVYSFSRPNNFVLPMFKGGLRPQVELEHAGVVTVGCNLHDQMIGYILVVDSPVFGKTGRDGKVRLEAENSQGLTVNIWNPRMKLEKENLAQSVKAGRSAQLTFLLTEELRGWRSNEMEALRSNAMEALRSNAMEALSWRENRIR